MMPVRNTLNAIHRTRVSAVAIAAVAALAVCGSASASAWYVDSSVTEAGAGTSWETAFKRIQEGIDAAEEGDEVVVGLGVYKENIEIPGKNITLRGIYPLSPAWVAETIIDGNRAGPVVRFSGAETEQCVLSGFTLRNGRADYGGGICGGTRDNHSSATIDHNTITANLADKEGGGLAYCAGLIRNNTIEFNTAFEYGGGLAQCDGTIQDNTIADNWAEIGAGLHECGGIVEENAISNNWADRGGGLSGCGGTLQGNTIEGNRADSSGGGLSDCRAEILSNVIRENRAEEGDGGGLYGCHGHVRDNRITGNESKWWGGGLAYCGGLIEGNEINGNEAQFGGALYYCDGEIRRNVISENVADLCGGLHSCDGLIEENTISNNEEGGCYLCNGDIQGNIISGNTGWPLGALDSCDGMISNNIIRGNSYGLYSCNGIISNNIICGNSDYGLRSCDGIIRNNMICGNSVGSCNGTICNNTIIASFLGDCWGTIQNCIAYGYICRDEQDRRVFCSFPAYALERSSSPPTYSWIEGWTFGGEGNIAGEPPFVDPDGPDGDPKTWEDNDYRLLPNSPCIDAGKNEDWMWDATDLDGNPRILYGGASLTVDMGAYEYIPPFEIVEVAVPLAGGFEISWVSSPGQTYIVWSCVDLMAGQWTEEATIVAQDTMTSWVDSAPAGRMEFYRVEMSER